MADIPVTKNSEYERPVPHSWRPALKSLADYIVCDIPSESHPGVSLEAIDNDSLSISRANMEAYPAQFGPLSCASWDSSVYIWMQDHWDILIDLTTRDGKVSDLVLHASAREAGDELSMRVGLVYVH